MWRAKECIHDPRKGLDQKKTVERLFWRLSYCGMLTPKASKAAKQLRQSKEILCRNRRLKYQGAKNLRSFEFVGLQGKGLHSCCEQKMTRCENLPKTPRQSGQDSGQGGSTSDYTRGSEKRHCASPAPGRRPDQYPDYSRLSEAHDREGRHGCSGRNLIALGPSVVHAAKAQDDCAILLTFAIQ